MVKLVAVIATATGEFTVAPFAGAVNEIRGAALEAAVGFEATLSEPQAAAMVARTTIQVRAAAGRGRRV
jgi:hypothetical protein